MDKITVSFKCPDAVDSAVERYVSQNGCDEEKEREVREELERWIQWGEYVRIVFDLDEGTASVEKYK